MNTAEQRRDLRFTSLDEIANEGERLHRDGFEARGAWNLSQVCNHLADWMSFPMDGFPRPNLLIGCMLWMLKVTVGKRQLAKILETRSMPPASPTMPQTVSEPERDEEDAVRRLRETVERLKTYRGDIHPSPLFGTMDYDTCVALQCIHASHHFSFLHPAPSSDNSSSSS